MAGLLDCRQIMRVEEDKGVGESLVVPDKVERWWD